MALFGNDYRLFKNRLKKDDMPKMTVVPEKIIRHAAPIGDFRRRITQELANRLEREGIVEAGAVTGENLYPAILQENHDALIKSPQFKGMKLDKPKFCYFLGVNFFCLGVIHHYWEGQLGKSSNHFTAQDTGQMNAAVKKKKDNYALSFSYLGKDPKSDYGKQLARAINQVTDLANRLSAETVQSDSDYSKTLAQIFFQAGYAVCDSET